MKKLIISFAILLTIGLCPSIFAQSNRFKITPLGIVPNVKQSVFNDNQNNESLSADVWEPIGPNGITSNAVAVDPQNTNIIYAGGLSGLYKTINGGINWLVVGDPTPIHNVKYIAINPINPNILLIWSYYGVELSLKMLRSTDAGTSWTEVLNGSGSRGSIIFNYQNPLTVYANATSDYVYKSTDGGINWVPISSFTPARTLVMDANIPDILYATRSANLYKTTDGGQSWDLVNSQLPVFFYVLKVSISSSDILFAGDRDYYGGFYKSNNGGISWTQSNSGFGSIKSITKIGVDRENENILYAGGFASGLYLSTDKGDQWSLISDTIYDNYVSAITTMPNNKLFCSFGGSIFLTSDQGASWNSLNGDLKNVDVFNVVVHPTDPNILYASSFAGIYRSSNGGRDWQQINNGILDTDAFALTIDPINPNILYAGSFGGLIYKTTNGGDVWEESSNGLPGLGQSTIGKLTVHQDNPSWIWSGNYNAFHSLDGGDNWSELFVLGERIHEMVYAPDNGNIMYALSHSKLYRTTDQGFNWDVQNISQSLNELVVDPNDSNVLYANNFGEISKSTDGGLTWNILEPLWAREITVNPQHSNFVYAATFGNGVRRSTDGGTSWHNYNNSLPILSCFSVKSATGQPHKLFVATFGGSIYQVDETVTSVKNSTYTEVSKFQLSQNHPNPFNPTTTIKYQIPELSFVTLKVYDVLGNEIATLVNEEKPIGSYEVEFNATSLPSGIYFYKLQAGDFVEIKKMVLMK